jgi:hypothetical protein
MRTAETRAIDTHFEGCRLKDRKKEELLLTSILEQGLKEPLQCIEKPGGEFILLDGFKRLRCAKKLGIEVVPVASLGEDAACGILQLIRVSAAPGLTVFEQAALVDELNRSYEMGVREIARQLDKSAGWVAMRLGLIENMSPAIKKEILSGRFSVRGCVYIWGLFTRVNTAKDVNAFVKAVSGKGLSIREIEILAGGYFKGGAKLKEQILGGNIDWTLRQMKQKEPAPFDDTQDKALKDLKLAEGCIRRIPYKITDPRLKTDGFLAAAEPVILTILKRLTFFRETLEEFHGYTGGEEKSGKDAVRGRKEKERDCQAA